MVTSPSPAPGAAGATVVRRVARWAAGGLFALVVLVNVDRAAPAFDWDLIGYMAVANSYSTSDPAEIHARTYRMLQRQIPPPAYEALTRADDPIRATVARDPEVLHALLSLYAVKPLYPVLMYLVDRTGISLVDASSLISRLAYVATAIVIGTWLRTVAGHIAGLLLASVIVSFPPLVRLAQYATPDALSVGLSILSFSLVWGAGRPVAALLVAAIAITARPDNIAFFVPLAALLFATHREARVALGACVLLGIALYVGDSVVSGNPGWKVTFYRSFVRQEAMAGLAGDPAPLTVTTYLGVLLDQYRAMLHARDLVLLFMPLGLVALWRSERQSGAATAAVAILAASCFNIGVHLVAFPRELDRFLAGAYVAIMIMAVAVALGRTDAAPPRSTAPAAG